MFSDSISRLLKHETLSSEEIVRLIEKGDDASINKIVEHSFKLVAKVIQQEFNRVYLYQLWDDLFQVGVIRLMEVVRGFDPSYYNGRNLEKAYVNYVYNFVGLRLSREMRKKGFMPISMNWHSPWLRKYNKVRDVFQAEAGRIVTTAEMAQELGLSSRVLEEMISSGYKGLVSIESPLHSDTEDTHAETLVDPNQLNEVYRLIARDEASQIKKRMEDLRQFVDVECRRYCKGNFIELFLRCYGLDGKSERLNTRAFAASVNMSRQNLEAKFKKIWRLIQRKPTLGFSGHEQLVKCLDLARELDG